jgi:microsomal dipeptidase-like Zn-dependent dipeptidase
MAIVGYADLHCHPMAHLGFGGLRNGRAYFWGKPTEAIDQALPCCSPAHDVWRGGGILPHFTEHEQPGFDGFDSFTSWPRCTSTIHQQMYVDGIKRAFRGGLKLMVASAVNNELLGDLYQGRGGDSTDETAVAAQLLGIRALAAECVDWMAIVSSPAEARATIEGGKLAVILGIEVDSIAGPAMRREQQLTPLQAVSVVQEWWDEGVRLINPVHLADNALAGTAIYDDRFNLSNHYLIRKWAGDLPEPWFWQAEEAANDTGDVEFLLSGNKDNALLIQLYNQSYPAYIKQLGRKGHVNSRGLSESGAAFVQAMMDKGMLVDVEHLSSHALDAVIAIAKQRPYPLVSSHTGLRALAVPRNDSLFVPGCATEAMRSDRQLLALKTLGGVLGVGGHVGLIKDLQFDVSTGWARAYKHARDDLGFEAVGIGTDMNGFATAPGGRFQLDPNAPEGLSPKDHTDVVRPIRYGTDLIPIVRQVLEQTALGKKTYSFNTDGLAHYALLPDFTLDVALNSGAEEALEAFFHSAEAFIEAWERCVPH